MSAPDARAAPTPTPQLPGWLTVDRRPGPSAHVGLVRGPQGAVLVDTGAGTPASDARLDCFLAEHGLEPGALTLVVLTHWHADHAGGAARLQRRFGVPVAAHHAEASLIAAGSPDTGDGAWLRWGAAAYTVDRPLRHGDLVDDAGVALRVVQTPGQTPGHIALVADEERVALTGDLLQVGDVGWMPISGPWAPGAADRLIDSVGRLAALDLRLAVPGHGPPVTDVPDAVARSLARYTQWREEPVRAGWHAARRAFVSITMLEPLDVVAARVRVRDAGWVTGVGALAGLAPDAVVDRLVEDLIASGALAMRAGFLEPQMPYEARSRREGDT